MHINSITMYKHLGQREGLIEDFRFNFNQIYALNQWIYSLNDNNKYSIHHYNEYLDAGNENALAYVKQCCVYS